MTRQEAINIISAMYPADSQHPDAAQIGQKLLEQAKREIAPWRVEPTEILVRYAMLCIEEEEK